MQRPYRPPTLVGGRSPGTVDCLPPTDPPIRSSGIWALLRLCLVLVVAAPSLAAQTGGSAAIRVSLPGGEGTTLPIERHRGFPAVDAATLGALGWEVVHTPPAATLQHRSGVRIHLSEGSPFLRWNDDLLQMVHAPYRVGGRLYLPVQLVVDLFPGLFPAAYRYDSAQALLLVEGAAAGGAPRTGSVTAPETAGPPVSIPGSEPSESVRTAARRAPRLVVIDPGHGGSDPGAIGAGGSREKDIALALGLALARELAADPDIEVRLTRDTDILVPLWERGSRATEWKGERPGVFLSIHANALPERPGVRGFETYFLSEARTEHEARVAAAENAPMERGQDDDSPSASDPLLASILRDLRTFDHQHWSALLAEMVQRELSSFHPGSDRGVKQGPFAVITNSLMPSVLVELGFVTNREEERLMTSPDFHRNAARALAAAVREFFARYPPGGAG